MMRIGDRVVSQAIAIMGARLRRLMAWGSLALVMLVGACSNIGATPTPTVTITPLNIPAIANALVCPQGNSITHPGTFAQSDGQQLVYNSQFLRLTGSTFYPGSAGGSAAWRSPQFTQYIDHILDMEAQAGQNLIRPTDFWNPNDAGQQVDDPVVWHNLDYAVCAAKQRGMFVIMDISAFKWLLMVQSHDPYDIQRWESFLLAVARHYRDEPAIVYYSILGEPSPPQTPEASRQLVAFYRTLTDTLYAADPHHLISAGGFNHMEDESPQMPWWHQIYALPHNDIDGFKTYSQLDIDLMPTIVQYSKSIHKLPFDEEFGLPQSQGDAVFAGGAGYNQIKTSRAQFFDTVYSTGESLGVVGFIFWNIGCEVGDSSYEVSPLTPAVWQVIKQHAAVPPAPSTSLCA